MTKIKFLFLMLISTLLFSCEKLDNSSTELKDERLCFSSVSEYKETLDKLNQFDQLINHIQIP